MLLMITSFVWKRKKAKIKKQENQNKKNSKGKIRKRIVLIKIIKKVEFDVVGVYIVHWLQSCQGKPRTNSGQTNDMQIVKNDDDDDNG